MLEARNMEAGSKPMYSSMGFLSSVMSWMDGGADIADGPQTSSGFTV